MVSLLLAVIYLAFISLGLPDSILGAAWPAMYRELSAPLSYAGYVSMVIALGTIGSSLLSERVTKRWGAGVVTAVSVSLTAAALFGFSLSSSYWALVLWAVPYGLGAGSVDAALNNYVAMNYSSSVMNFLHCFYGLGAAISPHIMSAALRAARWNEGYRWTAYLQAAILAVCILSAPLWKKSEQGGEVKSSGIGTAIKLPGVVPTLIAFFAYCAGEATCFLWTSSYFAGAKTGVSPELAAAFGSLIFGGLMLGRFISALVSDKLGDKLLIRIGIAVEFIGIILVMLPVDGYIIAAAGFIIIGTGMGPVYPAIQHMVPTSFGNENSAAVIGLQMASAYTGSTLMPMVFGHIQQAAGIWILPLYLIVFAVMNIGLLEFAYTRIKGA